MGDKTSIEWTRGDDGTPGATWNPTTGCDKVSPGCDHCYALTMAKRLKGMGSKDYQNDGDPRTSGPGFAATMHPHRLDQPLHWKRPRRIFVNSMSDLFHDAISDEFIAQVFAVMALAPQHTFQVLTKRHGRMRSLLRSEAFEAAVFDACEGEFEGYFGLPLPNVWLGVSVEDQKWADIRIPALLDTPAAVRFLSCEPLLRPITLRREWLVPQATVCGYTGKTTEDHAAAASVLRGFAKQLDPRAAFVDWVIAGGESGPGARPMHPDWARSLRDQCAVAGIPFFLKQTGTVLAREWGLTGKGHDPAVWPEYFPQQTPEPVSS
jgi:protein gp37